MFLLFARTVADTLDAYVIVMMRVVMNEIEPLLFDIFNRNKTQ